MSNTALGIKDRTDLVQGVNSFVRDGGKIKEVPVDQTKAIKLDGIRRALFYPAQHKFYARHTGINVNRLRQLNRNLSEITEAELDAFWSFIENRTTKR